MEMIFGGVKYELRVEFKSLRVYVSKDGNKTVITDDKGCPIFDIQGTRYRNKDNVEQIFTRVQPYRIEPRQTGQPSAPVQQPTPQLTYQQPPQNFPPPVDVNGNVKDDLPF